METLNTILPVTLSVLGIILLIVLIILGIKLIYFVDKADRIADNVETKVNAVNSIFGLIERASDGATLIVDSIINSITRLFTRESSNVSKEDSHE